MERPELLVLGPKPLFQSFFAPAHQRRLGRSFTWKLDAAKSVSLRLRRQLASTVVLITTWDSPPLGDDLLQIAPKLRIIAHCGGEVKRRFTPLLLDRLTIATAPEPMGHATAELAAALVLYCGRGVDTYREALRKPDNRIYRSIHTHGTPEFLTGRELGMIGFGRIGRVIVELLRGFDFRWKVYDPYASRKLEHDYAVKFVNLQTALEGSSLLVLAAALTDETRGIIDPQALARLPDGATVINVARGELLDMNALTREVRRGRLRCAIDVSDPVEPLPVKHPLRRLPGAIVTPHIGGGSVQARHAMADDLIDDLERFLKGEPVKHRVTSSMLARMT